MTGGPRIPCVGAVVLDGEGRLLLVRRGREPGLGLWSVPGGRVEPGESDPQALVREVREETGLEVRPGAFLGTVERAAPGGGVYVIADYLAAPAEDLDPRSARAGDDAVEVGWFEPAALASPGPAAPATVPGLVEALLEWGVLPPVAPPG